MTDTPRHLKTGEVARMFRVDPKTVGHWARDGKLEFIRSPGGHRLFPASQFTADVLDGLSERRTLSVSEVEPGQWLWFGNQARQVRQVVFAPPTDRTFPDRVAWLYFEDSPVGVKGDEGQTVRLARPSEIPTTQGETDA